MGSILKIHKELSKELNCSWGNKENLYLLKKDLSVQENLDAAMQKFPMLKKLVNEYKFPLEEIERCRKECSQFVFSEEKSIWQLKEFFGYWLIKLH